MTRSLLICVLLCWLLIGPTSLWADEAVTWTNVVAASATGNNLTKTAGTTAWDAGASSVQVIRDGYGYVEFTATETTTYRIAGLSNGDSNQNYTDVDFGMLLRSDASVGIWEAGTYRGEVGTYAANDRFRVEVRYGVVRYFRNGTLLYTSPSVPRYPLRVDAALNNPNATLTNVRIGNLVWTGASGVSISGQSLTKTNATAGWNSGASSTNTIETADGFVEFAATETNKQRAAGLGNGDTDQGLNDVEFGIILRSDGYVEVSESGTSRGTFAAYLSGDVFRVEVRVGTVRYYQNGVSFYTSLLTPNYPLRADSSFDTAGATITDLSLHSLIWTSTLGVSVQGTNLTKTASTGWNAAASSTNTIASLDGWMEFTTIETNSRRVAGLKTTGVASDYMQIDFAIEVGDTGTITIWELGVSKGTFGAYANGDRFRIEIQDGNVRYRKNGSVLYTSTTAPSYPLHIEATLYTAGATFVDIAMGDMVWKNETGVKMLGNGIQKTNTSNNWNTAGAFSTKAINSGYVEWMATETATYRIAGLGNTDSNQDYTDVDYGVLWRFDASVAIYESGTYRGEFGTYAPGDRFKVEILNNVVKYYKNGTLLYTSSVTPALPLRVDVAFRETAGTYFNFIFSGTAVLQALPLPTISPGTGSYTTTQSVTLSHSSSGVTIRYTTDGSTPTSSSPAYSTPISVDQTLTLKAIAQRTGWLDSNVASAVYTMSVATPSFSPGAGAYSGAQTVTISTATSAATLRYTTDGSDPTATSAVASAPITVDRSMMVKVKGFKTGWTTSAMATATYMINLGTVATPSFTPAAGTFTSAQNVTITTTTSGATIRYTTDGTDPNFKSRIYTGPVLISSTTQLKAKAFKSDMNSSAAASGLYVIDLGTVDIPRLSPGSGTYATAQTVTITCETPGADIHYTTNGAEPTQSDTTVVSGGTVSIAQAKTLKVKAWKAGLTASGVGRGDYFITGAVSGGHYHMLALKADGTVWAWGLNTDGQLGSSAGTFSSTPVQIPSFTNVAAVAGGSIHSVALKNDGTVWSWGKNDKGQLGVTGISQSTIPVQVTTLSGIVAIAAGEYHSLALKNDGTVWIWGQDSIARGNTPTQVTAMTGITQIVAGNTHSYVLKTDGEASGSLWAWGSNTDGQLGDGTTISRSGAAPVLALASIAMMGAGGDTGVAVNVNGAIWGWGDNAVGQVGDSTTTDRTLPTPVQNGDMGGITAVDAGSGFTLAYQQFSPGIPATVWTWGINYGGTLGNGSTSGTPSLSPLRNLMKDAVSVSSHSRSDQSMALRVDGTVWTWGTATWGELGNGLQNSTQATPAAIAGFSLVDNSSLFADADGDGLSTWREMQLGTDPANPDTNGDGVRDDVAVNSGLSATNPDMDGDTVSNATEIQNGTDPFRADTDGDGVNDAADCFPLDATRSQCPAPTPGDTTPPVISITVPTNATLTNSVPPQ